MSTPEIVEALLAEFNEELRLTGEPNFSLCGRCPEEHRKELTALMNVATLVAATLAETNGLPQEAPLEASRKVS